ncbi:hypothetical protein BME96_11120 [Virgibacillus halodenitrificans]|uniref:Uncharacterized protein n=1 Tax=Virgibacillus halodenitrificans TaxID=1482 RepID=A0AAC9J1A1_VIRHA|nr:hypothetical protein BME96_11120 [Virgibacillus halodenitrificans]
MRLHTPEYAVYELIGVEGGDSCRNSMRPLKKSFSTKIEVFQKTLSQNFVLLICINGEPEPVYSTHRLKSGDVIFWN